MGQNYTQKKRTKSQKIERNYNEPVQKEDEKLLVIVPHMTVKSGMSCLLAIYDTEEWAEQHILYPGGGSCRVTSTNSKLSCLSMDFFFS